MLFLAIIN